MGDTISSYLIEGESVEYDNTQDLEYYGVPYEVIDRYEIGSYKSKIYKVDHQKRYNGGEKNGHDQLNYFLNSSGKNYSSDISSPLRSEKSCSRLSPYLTFGNLSIRQIIKATRNRQTELRELKSRDGWLKSLSAFSSRLRWHCHFIQKLEMQPDLEYTNMVRAFDGMRDNHSEILFNAWKNGITGYPMVDACMRFLKKTGWINFRTVSYTHLTLPTNREV